MKEHIKAIVRAGIPVIGHIGLTPQTASMTSGFKVQGIIILLYFTERKIIYKS